MASILRVLRLPNDTMVDVFKTIFSDAGIQWGGWAAFVVLTGYVLKTQTAALNKNTEALTKLTVLIQERVPRGGS